jgi:anti-sigma B factor antagonist
MPVEFSIRDEPVDADTHVLTVQGEIDIFTAPEFKQALAVPIEAGRTNVVVDLTEVTFLDSSSLGVLIGAHKRLGLRGGKLTVVAEARPIVNTFKVTGLDGVFRLVKTRDQALQADGALHPA